MKKLMVISMLLLLAVAVQAQTGTVKTYAYSRTVIPGVPPGGEVASFPPEYYIYIILPAGAAPEIRGVWINKRMHAATLQKVTGPILQPEDPALNLERRDTLVPATRQQIYRVFVGDTAYVPMATKQEDMMRGDYCLVVYLKANNKWLYGRMKAIKQLPPLRLM